MAISVVQSKQISSASSGTFTANVTAGNAVVLVCGAYNSSGGTVSITGATAIGSSSPTLTFTLTQASESAGTGAVIQKFFVFANSAGGGNSFSFTVGASTTAFDVKAYEISGLGAAPTIDQSITTSGPNTTGNPASGTTGAITSAPELIVGSAIGYALTSTTPGAPWTNLLNDTNSWSWCGLQIAASSGGTYSWSQTSNGTANWTAGVATIAATASSTPGTPVTGGTVARHPRSQRGWWERITGTVRGTPVTGGLVRTRKAARAVWKGGTGTVQGTPATGGLVRRRAVARAVWRSGSGTVRGLPVTGGLVRRRAAARGFWKSGTGTVAGMPVTGGRVARRGPARAVWRTVTGTVRGAAATGGRVARRGAARAIWRNVAGQPVPPGPPGTVQPLIAVWRRAHQRGVWRNRFPPGVNRSAIQGLAFRTGMPYLTWQPGPPDLGDTEFLTGMPYLTWVSGPAEVHWETGMPEVTWQAGPASLG